jgi:hydroxymethylglutaryl-CoA lyase
MHRDVIICEVGPRDGLQLVQQVLPAAAKQAWIEAEARAGVPEIEVTSFVRADVMPQFADAAEVAARALSIPGLTVSVLVPNLKGAELAFATHPHKVNYVLSASESHNLRNVRRPVKDSLEDFRRIVELRDSNPGWRAIPLRGYISTSFGCTIEGAISEDVVVRLAEKYFEFGASEVTLADTVGYANPVQAKRLFRRVRNLGGDVSAHFHDTRGLGLANAFAALETGVRRFDSSLAGLGGCPFAPLATGNIVTEDLVFMLESGGLRTGIDLAKLIETRKLVQSALPSETLHGWIAKAGLPKGFA